jgi:hypothetical protein
MISFSADKPGSNAQLYKICEREPFFDHPQKKKEIAIRDREIASTKDAADYASLV